MSCWRHDFSITEARGRDQGHSDTKWFETVTDPNMLKNTTFETSTTKTLEIHLNSVIAIIY